MIDRDKQPPIEPFEGENENDERFAALARALIGLLPFGGAIIEFFERWRREAGERKRDEWLRGVGNRVNWLQMDLREAEGHQIAFKVGKDGTPDVGSFDSDDFLVTSLTDHGANDFEIHFAEAMRSSNIVVSPISGSPAVKVLQASTCSLRFAFNEENNRAGRAFKLHLRTLPLRRGQALFSGQGQPFS